jgi:hypothetical protein
MRDEGRTTKMRRAILVGTVLALMFSVTSVTAAPTLRPIKPTKAKAIRLTRTAIVNRDASIYAADWPDLGMKTTLRVGCVLLDARAVPLQLDGRCDDDFVQEDGHRQGEGSVLPIRRRSATVRRAMRI